jgi:L-ascorbate metabolism protein UlaG (beta-lactamase superfamily)
VIDPFDESIGLKLPKLDADILLITHNHPDHANTKIAKKETFIIDSPGEYELRDIFIEGIFSFHDNEKGKERGGNTIYTIETEGVRICHMGDFGQEELTDEQLRKIGDIDVLMIPIGGTYTIDAKGATKVISQIEPRMVVPMHYKIPGLKVKVDDLDAFLKAIGSKKAVPEEKLSVQKKNLSDEEMNIVPLIPQSKSS